MKKIPWRALAAFSMVAAAVSFLAWGVASDNAGKMDFISYWAAGQQVVHGANPYDSAALLRLERPEGLVVDRPNVMLNWPVAFYLTIPLGYISSRTGSILWILLIILSLGLSIRLLWILNGRPNNRSHLICYLFAPAMACLFTGQLGTLLLLGVVLFLFFIRSRPEVAGAAMLLCVVKPHLFVPFGVVLIAWALSTRAYRFLAGAGGALMASCALTYCFDPQAWSQYAQMMHNSNEVHRDLVPTLSVVLRVLLHAGDWPQFLPVVAASAWALWYYKKHRASWDWMHHGLLLLLISELCSPHAWLTDETIVLPAILAGVYQADRQGRSMLPLTLFFGAALMEMFLAPPLVSMAYIWTPAAWLAWYLYATRNSKTAKMQIAEAV